MDTAYYDQFDLIIEADATGPHLISIQSDKGRGYLTEHCVKFTGEDLAFVDTPNLVDLIAGATEAGVKTLTIF